VLATLMTTLPGLRRARWALKASGRALSSKTAETTGRSCCLSIRIASLRSWPPSVLDHPGHLEVHDARLITDRYPGVDGACGLVHAVPGGDQVAGAADLPGARQVEGMDFAGMAVQWHTAAWLQSHQLGPAVRAEPQGAERLTWTGRDPRQGASVKGPSGFVAQMLHGFSHTVGTGCAK